MRTEAVIWDGFGRMRRGMGECALYIKKRNLKMRGRYQHEGEGGGIKSAEGG
jgi:hypothetical protein